MIDRYAVGVTTLLLTLIAILLGVHLLQESSPASTQTDTEGMNMASNAHYRAQLRTDSAGVRAGQPFNLTLEILEADGDVPVTDFDEVHTKLLHLILVSKDLSQFLHVHPDYMGDGEFVLEDTVVAAGGSYAVFADFTPSGDHQQVIRLTLPTQDAQATAPEMPVGANEFITGLLKFRIDLPEFLDAGVEQTIRFHIASTRTGEPLNTLDEYLGAGGHLVIVDETTEMYLHTHPAEHDMGAMERMTMTYGPDLEFVTEFPGMGLYKMWLQVQYQGEVYTAPFVVSVSDLAEATSDAGHGHGQG